MCFVHCAPLVPCRAFAAVASIEGAYQIATGALRSLSEQQLIECSVEFGNQGCKGGNIVEAYEYVVYNKGLDSESDYPYIGVDYDPCWTVAANRTVATISNWTSISNGSETGLVAGASMTPVAVAIDASDPIFQVYSPMHHMPWHDFSVVTRLLLLDTALQIRRSFWHVRDQAGPWRDGDRLYAHHLHRSQQLGYYLGAR
jgi:hypothetical protein